MSKHRTLTSKDADTDDYVHPRTNLDRRVGCPAASPIFQAVVCEALLVRIALVSNRLRLDAHKLLRVAVQADLAVAPVIVASDQPTEEQEQRAPASSP